MERFDNMSDTVRIVNHIKIISTRAQYSNVQHWMTLFHMD